MGRLLDNELSLTIYRAACGEIAALGELPPQTTSSLDGLTTELLSLCARTAVAALSV